MISSSSAPPIRSTVERRSRPGRHEPQAMEVAAETDRRAVAQAAARRDLGPVACLVREVAA
jgi:hypothetical protein